MIVKKKIHDTIRHIEIYAGDGVIHSSNNRRQSYCSLY